jgi:hypothetical protein
MKKHHSAGKVTRAHGISSFKGSGRLSSFTAPAPSTLGAVKFKALMKELNVKSLVSGDKAARVTFEIESPGDSMVDELNRLMKADALVNVGVWK